MIPWRRRLSIVAGGALVGHGISGAVTGTWSAAHVVAWLGACVALWVIVLWGLAR
ncbi:MAG TPA: hypothetical protein VMR79_03390 [Verrucomicrobiae bacterium]|nr:hypothetical protein [Verrucomicrobiae bacterium]